MIKDIIKRILKSRLVTTLYIGYIKCRDVFCTFLKDELNDYYTHELRSRVKAFGNKSRINGRITTIFPKGIFIGNNVHIGGGGFLDGRGGLIIGDNTHISRNVTIYSTNHNYGGDLLPYDHKYIAREVIIGKNVWIGMNVCITPGVYIGDGAIIGMGAVVSKDIGEGEIVVTGQQRVIGQRDINEYDRKEINELYGGISGKKVPPAILSQYFVSPLEAKEVVFILSTGRSGSTTMARMFEAKQGISAFHETLYFMLSRLSIGYITGRIGDDEAEKMITNYFKKIAIVRPGNIYLESDQTLVPFIGILNKIFREPKFIWLIRHPKTFMHSAASRGWFKGDDPSFYKDQILVDPIQGISRIRITGYLTGEFSKGEWKTLDQRGKILWYWKYWNTLIETGLRSVANTRAMTIKMEEIEDKYEIIMKFLNMNVDKNWKIDTFNPVLKKDIQRYREGKELNYRYFSTQGQKMIQEEMRKWEIE